MSTRLLHAFSCTGANAALTTAEHRPAQQQRCCTCLNEHRQRRKEESHHEKLHTRKGRRQPGGSRRRSGGGGGALTVGVASSNSAGCYARFWLTPMSRSSIGMAAGRVWSASGCRTWAGHTAERCWVAVGVRESWETGQTCDEVLAAAERREKPARWRRCAGGGERQRQARATTAQHFTASC